MEVVLARMERTVEEVMVTLEDEAAGAPVKVSKDALLIVTAEVVLIMYWPNKDP